MSSYRNVCLETKGRSVHHLRVGRVGDGSNNDLGNFEPVCRSCHEKIHAGTDGGDLAQSI